MTVPPIPKPGIRKKPKAKALLPERDLQSLAENLCLSLGIRFFRIPDMLQGWLMRFGTPWVRVFVSRYLSGVPDMMIFKPCGKAMIDGVDINEGYNLVRFIEIKTEAGKLSQGQKKWHSSLSVLVTYGWPETEKAIRDFAA